MVENKLARMDAGEANRRILSKEENRADFRRVEAASVKRKTNLRSAEGKRLFARCFYSFQASMYFISQMGRTKLPHEAVEEIEAAVRKKLEEATAEMNKAIDGADALLKTNNIDTVATYDTVPFEEEVGITSALGRRYFELIHKLDQMMPLLQTLQIEEVINERNEEKQRSLLKRSVLSISSSARNLSAGVRRRMNEMDREPDAGAQPKQAAKQQAKQATVVEAAEVVAIEPAAVATDSQKMEPTEQASAIPAAA
ncbi:DUF1845 domain-containing protein [Piscinibacter gummiphilus]|uniref:DUF1845 domain-containing protein n=1 Tax=Piscinibacter gummiphilus TaxID=946333 RepID=A0ABZ0D793_9BURK|nr:DUF1845 domain-containing protein [Piscinibacter gummiphilus]WOB11157.1 DUF1845 domain-containing protein [Piscinibacter gummiphilus]